MEAYLTARAEYKNWPEQRIIADTVNFHKEDHAGIIQNSGILDSMSETDTLLTQFVNTLGSRQNGCHFPEDIFKYTFLMKNHEFLL